MDTMKFDGPTGRWMEAHIGVETTVARCPLCGLFYKPLLGHKCPAAAQTKEKPPRMLEHPKRQSGKN